jgi:SpoVK/Ycf46/Vps4 family AAA+-type ATPase
MTPELIHHLRSLTRALYFVTDEEDRFIVRFHEQMKKHESRTWVYNGALGLQPIGNIIRDWSSRSHTVSPDAATINDALIKIYQDDPKDNENFYIITDPDRFLKDEQVVRRVLNIIHQLHQDLRIVKCLIFAGPRKMIPEKLQRYIEVVQDTGMTGEEINSLVETFCKQLRSPVPKDSANIFKGMTSYEVEQAITQSVVRTKKDPVEPRRVDPKFVAEYKRNQLKKTDLVSFVDTTEETFDTIGGAQRFKAWAKKSKACWSDKGQKFGLKPPRGVLLVGVYGCGKSVCAKAMAREWDLPLVQFEMGKLRSSGVGDSEGNLYRALRIVESVSPCVMWIDEAEKSLAGGQSSAQSDAGTTSRLLGILSTWAQESKTPVCIAMTANSLKTLPVEMVNRMPQRFFFDLPNEEDRIDILKIHAKKSGQDMSSFNLADLADKGKNLVGREIEQSIQEAMVESFTQGKPGLDEEILGTELSRRPRIIKTMTDEIKEILDWVGYDAEVDDGIRARLASNHRSEQFKMISGGTK